MKLGDKEIREGIEYVVWTNKKSELVLVPKNKFIRYY